MNADTVNNQRVMDYYLLGQICYSAGQAAQDSVELMNMYLLKADTMFQVVVERSPTDYWGYLWRSRAAAVRDPELKEGLAKPLYEETLTVLDQDPSNKEKAATKRFISRLINIWDIIIICKPPIRPRKRGYRGYKRLLEQDAGIGSG